MDELDLPAAEPKVPLPLNRVGTSARLVPINLKSDSSAVVVRHLCTVEMYANLQSKRRGLHISRLGEILQSASESEFKSLQELVLKLALEVKRREEADVSSVRVLLPWVTDDSTPLSGFTTKKIYEVSAEAQVNSNGANVKLGASVPIFIVCPCAQINLEKRLRNQIYGTEFPNSEIEKLISRFPVASHNQRGKVEVKLDDSQMLLSITRLIQAIEETVNVSHDLLKRIDEVEVVYTAHMNPKFCEDITRDVAVNLYKHLFMELGEDTNIFVRVTSEESIHSYDVISEISIVFRDIKDLL